MQKMRNKEMIMVRGGCLSKVAAGFLISVINLFGLSRIISRRLR